MSTLHKKGASYVLKSSFGMIASIYRDTTLASWASDIDGEESVCRKIRVQILKGINTERIAIQLYICIQSLQFNIQVINTN